MTRITYRHGLVATVNGDGPPLLLIHGLGSARSIWRTVLDRLAGEFTTVAVDLPGHGESDWPTPGPDLFNPTEHAEALKPLIDDFGGVMHVVGNSLGGWVGLELAADGRASSLTVLCSAGLANKPWENRSAVLVLRRRLARGLGPVLGPATTLVAKTPVLRDLIMGDATADFAALDVSVLADAGEAMRAARGFYASQDGMLGKLFERASEIAPEVPVSIVWGSQDTLVPLDQQRRAAAPPHANWIVLDHCAHVPMWDQPVRTIEIINDTAGASH